MWTFLVIKTGGERGGMCIKYLLKGIFLDSLNKGKIVKFLSRPKKKIAAIRDRLP